MKINVMKLVKNEKCKACNPSFEYRLYCGSCNDHYYLYNGIKSTEFKYCNTPKHCSKCEYIVGVEVCTESDYDHTMIN